MIIIKFVIKLLHHLYRFRVFTERVQHGKTFGQTIGIMQPFVKSNDLICYCFQSFSFVIFVSAAPLCAAI